MWKNFVAKITIFFIVNERQTHIIHIITIDNIYVFIYSFIYTNSKNYYYFSNYHDLIAIFTINFSHFHVNVNLLSHLQSNVLSFTVKSFSLYLLSATIQSSLKTMKTKKIKIIKATTFTWTSLAVSRASIRLRPRVSELSGRHRWRSRWQFRRHFTTLFLLLLSIATVFTLGADDLGPQGAATAHRKLDHQLRLLQPAYAVQPRHLRHRLVVDREDLSVKCGV